MPAPLRIGLLGASRVAVFAVIDPAREVADVEVAAVAARSPDRARAYAEAHEIARVHDSYEALFADPAIDLIYVGTPPSVHLKQALGAIAAGKHVLIEKPVAMNSDEAARILAAAHAAGVQVFEAMHSLHHPLLTRVAALIAEGRIGRVERIDTRFDAAIGTGPGEFRWHAAFGGGALMDLGVYTLAWCRFLLGETFEVEGATARWAGDVDMAFDATLRLADRVEAQVGASMDAPSHHAMLTVVGERGRIVVDNPLVPQRGHLLTLESGGTITTETVAGAGTFLAQLAAVRDALAGTAAFPLAADDFVHSMAAIDRVRAAMGASVPATVSS